MQLLPVEVIQGQVCSECSLYLTVLPITQLENGQILCGRTDCRKKNSTASLLNILMQSFQFHCVNYLDGCQELLTSATSKNHEKACKLPPRHCFFCSYKGNWAQILRHMKADHPSNTTEDCSFRFKVGEESSQKFIFLADDTCIVAVRTSSKKLTVIISMVNPSTINKINQITFKFCKYPYIKNQSNVLVEYCAFNNQSKNSFEKSMEELSLCFNLGSVVTCEIIFDFCELSEKELELEKKGAWLRQLMHDLSKQQKSLNDQNLEYSNQKINQEEMSKVLRQIMTRMFWCKVCNHPTSGEVYTCENYHVYCQNCMESESAKVNNVCKYFQKLEGLSKIYVTCERIRCSKLFSAANYLEHKSSCSQRLYKCPVNDCPVNVYSLKALEDHWHSPTKLIKVEHLEVPTFGDYTWFWLINNDLHKLYVKFAANVVIVDIESLGSVYNNKFHIEGWCSHYRSYKQYSSTNMITVNGKFVFSATTLPSGYGATKIKISTLIKN